MSPEDIFNTWECDRDAAWLRAIRALSDADFERLIQMQEEEERISEEFRADLGAIFEAGEEGAETGRVIAFPMNGSNRATEWEVPF